MTQPSKAEIEQLKEEAAKVAEAMSRAMFDAQCTKKASLVAAVRVAAGVAALNGMDLHRAIHMFMTFYKEADAAFHREGVKK